MHVLRNRVVNKVDYFLKYEKKTDLKAAPLRLLVSISRKQKRN